MLVGTTRDVLAQLLDRVDPAVIDEIERAAGSVGGVEAVHAARARWVGRSLHVLIHVEVDPDLPLRAAHDLGERARHAIFHAVPGWLRSIPAPGPGRESPSTTATARPCTTAIRAAGSGRGRRRRQGLGVAGELAVAAARGRLLLRTIRCGRSPRWPGRSPGPASCAGRGATPAPVGVAGRRRLGSLQHLDQHAFGHAQGIEYSR